MPDTTPKILVTDTEYGKAEPRFTNVRGFECLRAPGNEDDLAAEIRKVQARYVIVGGRRFAGALYEALPRGGVIARFGVGYDGIDLKRATEAGLLCTNTPGVLDQSVAEHTMLLVAAAAKGVVTSAAGMKAKAWSPVTGVELRGKRLTVVGCGEIGRAAARIAKLGYGMQVAGCASPRSTPPDTLEHFDSVTNDFAAAVRGADFVSIHIPANPQNARFVNRERLALLEKRAWLVNTARGAVVDEAALFDALAGGRLAGAALDVFEREPYVPAEGSGDLRTLANVILTPHDGSNTTEANHRMAERALQNIALADAREFARMDLLNRSVLP